MKSVSQKQILKHIPLIWTEIIHENKLNIKEMFCKVNQKLLKSMKHMSPV